MWRFESTAKLKNHSDSLEKSFNRQMFVVLFWLWILVSFPFHFVIFCFISLLLSPPHKVTIIVKTAAAIASNNSLPSLKSAKKMLKFSVSMNIVNTIMEKSMISAFCRIKDYLFCLRCTHSIFLVSWHFPFNALFALWFSIFNVKLDFSLVLLNLSFLKKCLFIYSLPTKAATIPIRRLPTTTNVSSSQHVSWITIWPIQLLSQYSNAGWQLCQQINVYQCRSTMKENIEWIKCFAYFENYR